MSTAAEAVFGVPELLEFIILLFETTDEIFLLQRVNRTFRDTIAGSAKLLRRMGLLHASRSISSLKAADLINTQLYGDDGPIMIKPFNIDIEKNAWLFTRDYRAWILNLNLSLTLPERGQVDQEFGMKGRHQLLKGKTDSWRRIKFTRVPIKVELRIRCDGQKGDELERIPLNNRDAYNGFGKSECTFGDVVDILERVTRVAEARWHRRRRLMSCVML